MNPAFLGAYLINLLNDSPTEASYGRYHPRNWPARRKAWIISILVFLEFFVTIIATTGSAAVHYALSDFPNDGKKSLMASFVSTYSFGQAVGSILIPQFTEAFGRRQFYLWSTGAFSVTCVVTGVTPSIVGVAFGRFLGGLASAVPAVVVAGSVEDLFDERSRIWLIWLWNCLTVAGQVLGPVYSTYIAARFGW
jgi:MFS family permease